MRISLSMATIANIVVQVQGYICYKLTNCLTHYALLDITLLLIINTLLPPLNE